MSKGVLLFGEVEFSLKDHSFRPCNADNGNGGRESDMTADISFRKLLLKASNNNSLPADASTKSGEGVNKLPERVDSLMNMTGEPALVLKQRNGYENIIEQLERKYVYGPGYIASNNAKDTTLNGVGVMGAGEEGLEEEEDEAEEEEEEGKEGKEEGEGEETEGGGGGGVRSDASNTVQRKRKRIKQLRRTEDAYDIEDPFIDDSEAYEEIDREMRNQRVRTKYSGFFVNSGDLEVESIAMEAVAAAIEEDNGAKKSDVLPSTKTSESITNRAMSTHNNESGNDKTTNNAPNVSDALSKRRQRLMKHEDLVAAFHSFAETVETSEVKMSRQRFPLPLQPSLLALDAVAIKCKVHNEPTYYAWLSEVLGSWLSAAKLKSHLILSRKQVLAIEAKDELDDIISVFKTKILSKIVKAPPPPAPVAPPILPSSQSASLETEPSSVRPLDLLGAAAVALSSMNKAGMSLFCI